MIDKNHDVLDTESHVWTHYLDWQDENDSSSSLSRDIVSTTDGRRVSLCCRGFNAYQRLCLWFIERRLVVVFYCFACRIR